MFRTSLPIALISVVLASSAGCAQRPVPVEDAPAVPMEWLAGDHHVHSEYSVGWRYKGDESATQPPLAQIGGDAIYPIEINARNARANGLDWMVTTDHGGPHHSHLNLNQSYPDTLSVREKMPDFFLFYGMEFDSPGADHATLIMPRNDDEARNLYALESRYNKREPFPATAGADKEERMNAAVTAMHRLSPPPLLIVNHPSRSADLDGYGKVSPEEIRRWNDLAPEVVVGMEGAPGHQARTIRPDGTAEQSAPRGGYEKVPTRGGFDPMAATVGGLWDALLGEGRHWWITATSDSHRHWLDGGDEFWPGEYSKTYVLAERRYDSIMDGLRKGRVFVTTGDLISALDINVTRAGSDVSAGMGQTLKVPTGSDVILTLAFVDPDAKNAHGDYPQVRRVDLITGKMDPGGDDANKDTNPTVEVTKRWGRDEFSRVDGEHYSVTYRFHRVTDDFYVRVRGTSTEELEPADDLRGENPWGDLWFYANPVFIDVTDN